MAHNGDNEHFSIETMNKDNDLAISWMPVESRLVDSLATIMISNDGTYF